MSELAKPHFLIAGKNRSAAVINSKIGNTQDKIVALIPINGDWLNIVLKLSCSINLVIDV